MKIKVMLLGNKDACSKLQQYLRDEEMEVVGSVYSEGIVLDEINRLMPDIILIIDTSAMTLRICQQIYLLRPRSIPVMIADVGDVDLMKRIMASGVHHVLPTSIEPLELVSEMKAIYSNERNRISTLEKSGTKLSKSKVLVVFGAKDGVGKTSLVTNLAINLAQKKNKVVILDYDLQFGDVGSFLGMEAKETIVELLQEQSSPNVDIIRQFLLYHLSGVAYLPAPHHPEDAKSVSVLQAERIIAALRIYYDYVIIDVASGFDDINTVCMDIASEVFLVTGTDIPAIRDTKKALSILCALTEKEKIKLIASRYVGDQVRIGDIEKTLEMPVWVALPEDRKIMQRSMNFGNPIALVAPVSKINKLIQKMARKIDGDESVNESSKKSSKTSQKTRRGLFGR